MDSINFASLFLWFKYVALFIIGEGRVMLRNSSSSFDRVRTKKDGATITSALHLHLHSLVLIEVGSTQPQPRYEHESPSLQTQSLPPYSADDYDCD